VVAPDRTVGDHVLHHGGQAADHGVTADPGELVHGGQAADDDEVAQEAVAAEGRLLGQDHVVADLAVMPDVALDHVEAVGAHAGHAAAVDGADIHRGVFADDVAIANHQLGVFAAIGGVLRRAAQHGERIDHIVFAELGVAIDHDVRGERRPRAQPDIRANGAERADLDAVAEDGPVGDDGRGMDLGAHEVGVSTSMAANSASAATLSPTMALPWNL
jgi:hypothetical protein